MTARTFVVFQDVLSEPLPIVKADVSPSHSPFFEPTVPVLSPTPVTTAEKENLHPVTGARSGAAIDSQSKKRKNSILTTKLHIPSTTKKSALDSRKRKTTTPSSSKSSSGGKVAGSGAPDLSRVEEVVEHEQPRQAKVTQAEVDSKCYDLTVSPLADVSHAFDQVSLSPAESRPNTSRILSPKQASLSEKGRSLSKPLAGAASLKKADNPGEEALFSTPERKQIYAAFTFTSPSPSSKRFAAPHLDIFGDIRFDP